MMLILRSSLKGYLLFPINIITIFELECCLASSSQVVRWLKVSLLKLKVVWIMRFIRYVVYVFPWNTLPHWMFKDSTKQKLLADDIGQGGAANKAAFFNCQTSHISWPYKSRQNTGIWESNLSSHLNDMNKE